MKGRTPFRIAIAASILAAAGGSGFVHHLWKLDESRSAHRAACSPEKIDAIASCTAWILAEPNNSWAFSVRASAHEKAGQLEQAMADYDAAIRLDPKGLHNHYMRGLLHARRLEHGRAVDDYTEALRLKPDAHTASRLHWNRAKAFEAIADVASAIADYSEVHRIDPLNATAVRERARLHFELKAYDNAIEDISLLLTGTPDAADLYYRRGYALLYGKGLIAEAIADFDRAIAIAPTYVAAYLSRVDAHLGIGDRRQALADLRIAIGLDPTFRQAADLLKQLDQQ